MSRRLAAAAVLVLGSALAAAAGASDREVPEKAPCTACEARGAQHGVEKVVAWREHEGETYYFCSEPCGEAFDGFPAAYVKQPVPRPAPAASVTRLDGTVVSLGELEADLVLLDFWATWCKPCVKSIPKLRDLHDEYAGQGFRVVGISIDEKGLDHVRKFADKKDMTYDVVLDDGESPAWFAYGVAAVPSAFLVNGEGQIVAEWKGVADPDGVRRAVEEELGAAAN